MSGDDYLPGGDEELDVWALSFYDTLKANYTLRGLPDPHRLTFTPGDRGTYLSVSLCRRNNSGLKGSRSGVQNIAMP
ncbi:MAG: hypothetical protein LBQ55_01325 [Treponema sp.]|nr:hypothetical protein [Treponema sp.]